MQGKGYVILCGTGSIASINLPGCAYELRTSLQRDVHIVVTRNALQFTTYKALESMSGHRVWTSDFEEPATPGVAPHLWLTDGAALIVVYPATANFIAHVAYGFADDLASSVVLAAGCTVIIAPAMHERMWMNPVTRANVRRLERRGVVVMKPETPTKQWSSVGAERGVFFPVDVVVKESGRLLKEKS
jgi:phosphopantothenoylcysteine decarboxylase / phosphopantothenate---cysteine ligase